jgi:hypothetical protein
MAVGIVTSGLPTNRIPHSRAKGFGESMRSDCRDYPQ